MRIMVFHSGQFKINQSIKCNNRKIVVNDILVIYIGKNCGYT